MLRRSGRQLCLLASLTKYEAEANLMKLRCLGAQISVETINCCTCPTRTLGFAKCKEVERYMQVDCLTAVQAMAGKACKKCSQDLREHVDARI